jgi:hypothetical protein
VAGYASGVEYPTSRDESEHLGGSVVVVAAD